MSIYKIRDNWKKFLRSLGLPTDKQLYIGLRWARPQEIRDAI